MPVQMTRKSEIKDLGQHFLRAAAVPTTFNEDDYTIEVIASSGSRGKRFGWFGDYYEELAVEPGAVRLERLNNGAAVLNSHSSYDLGDVIGVVEKSWLEGGQVRAKIRLSKTEDVATIVEKIREGVIRNISVGYFVHKYEELEETEEDGLPIYRAVDWEPAEVSFVAVPFDAKAQVRSEEKEQTKKTRCEIILINRGGQDMGKKKTVRASDEEVTTEEVSEEVENTEEVTEEAPAATEEEATDAPDESAAVAEEGNRVALIFKNVRKAGLEDSFAEELVKKKVSIARASEMILDRWAEKGTTVKTRSRISVESDPIDAMGQGIRSAILHRANPMANKLDDNARNYRGLSLIDMARDLMEAHNFNTRGMSRSEIAKKALSGDFWNRVGAHTTSDFPNILLDCSNKTLRQSYEETPRSFVPFVRFTSAPDFKPINRVQFGEAPTLDPIGEHGEVTYGTIGDGKEVYEILSYGKAFSVTRRTLINDDVNAIMRVPQLFGASGARLESDKTYAIFTGNPTMGDSKPLFHSDHKNLGTPGPIGDTTLTELRKLGRLQVGLDGVAKLNIQHRFLIVPASREVAALKAVSAITPNATSDVNVFQGLYIVIAEPRLDAASDKHWYAAAEPSQIDTIEIAYLDGQSGVRLDSEIEFETEGLKIKALHDFGVKAIDWRGLFKNESNT